jgi:hypothetical protein
VPKPYSFVSLRLALSEKQTPQIVEKIQNPKEQIEGVESSAVLRRQTLYPLSYGRDARKALQNAAFLDWARGGW